MEYTPLEQNNLSLLGVNAPSFSGASTSFYATSTFIYTLLFIAIVGAAFYQYTLAGIQRMEATSNSISKSNEIIKRVTLGLLGVFSLFLILFTVNKGMLRGDIGLSSFNISGAGGGSSQVVTTPSTSSGSGGSRSCESEDVVKQKLSSTSGLCGGTVCRVLNGCNYQEHLSIIKREASSQGVDPKLVVALICKESSGRKDAINKNENGTFDCGLMQINNGPATCPASLLDPSENIRRGVAHLKGVLRTSASYPSIPGVPALGNALSSYNCCANGTVPASASNDCTTAKGYKNTLPKWACPVNPGDGAFNMCSVKNYACEITSCIDAVNL
jgi:hypothetical protein